MFLVNWLQCGKAWLERAQKTEKSHSHANSAVSRHVYVHALLVQHHESIIFLIFFSYIIIFSTYGIFNIWDVPTSETDWMQRRQKKFWLKYTDFAELKKITNILFILFIYLFVSRNEVHSRNTHTLQNAGWWKQTKQNVVQGIETGGINRIYSNCLNNSSFFLSPSHFVAVRFVSLKKCTINCASV